MDRYDIVEVLLVMADEPDAAGVPELLAAARDDRMVTSAERDRLRKAVDAAR